LSGVAVGRAFGVRKQTPIRISMAADDAFVYSLMSQLF
jgi:hypothetical protein